MTTPWTTDEKVASPLRLLTAAGIVAIAAMMWLHDRPLKMLGEGSLKFTCTGTDDTVDCTFTNTSSSPGFSCAKVIISKTGSNLSARSLICSGRLDPYETKQVRGIWEAAFARDVCSNGEKPKILDWSLCKFEVESFDPR